jgi:MFS family permease
LSIALASTLADRYGRRPVYVACVALFAAGSVVAILAPNYGIFLAARAIQALGAGGIFPVATATIGDVVPAQRRGAALGLVAATWGLAAVIGPSLGGLITHYVSWRWIFAANLPLAGIVIARALRDVPIEAPHKRERLDGIGLALLCIGLLALMDGLITTHLATGLLGAGILACFALWERRSRFPIIPPELLQTPQLAKTYALGFVAALGALTFVVVIPVSGRALDRIGSRDVLLVGTMLTELGLAIFALGFQSLLLALLAMIVAGAGFGALLGAPTRFIVTNETPERKRATAVGLLSQALIVGQIVGSSMAGGLFALAHSEIAGYRHAYLAFCGVAFVALILAAMLKPQRDERRRPMEEAAAGAL